MIKFDEVIGSAHDGKGIIIEENPQTGEAIIGGFFASYTENEESRIKNKGTWKKLKNRQILFKPCEGAFYIEDPWDT